MKRFLKKTFFFAFLPVLIIGTTEAILSPTFFTYRSGEGLQYKSGMVPHFGHFHTNSKAEMIAQGDLCFYTKYSKRIKEFWQIDDLGYRNDSVIQKPDILIIGDSFIGGHNSTQSELFSKILAEALGENVRIYNMAIATLSQFDKLLKMGILKKPKLIIYESVERICPPLFEPYTNNIIADIKGNIEKKFEELKLSVPLDKSLRFYSIEWLRSRIRGLHGFGVPSVDTSLFFFKGKEQRHDESEFTATIAAIKSYKKYCDEQGIAFLYFPMPDKESVYYEQVPFEKQPDFLLRIDSAIKQEKIPIINSLQIFNDYRKQNTEMVFHADDTHWNLNGKKLIAREMAKQIKQSEIGKIFVNVAR